MTFRDDILALDGHRCRNPKCSSTIYERIAFGLSVHHITYKSHQGKDVPGNAISLCKPCDHAVHNGHGKAGERRTARHYMLDMLNNLEETAPDYRWHEPHEELTRKYGEVEK
jgi:hypothetical protein